MLFNDTSLLVGYLGRAKLEGVFEQAQNAHIQIHIAHVQSLIRPFALHLFYSIVSNDYVSGHRRP